MLKMKVTKFFKKKSLAIVYTQGDTVPKNVFKVIFHSSATEIPAYIFPLQTFEGGCIE